MGSALGCLNIAAHLRAIGDETGSAGARARACAIDPSLCRPVSHAPIPSRPDGGALH
jgi:hypothetical protein